MAVVVFDAANFKIRYPEFVGVADLVLSARFDEATLYLNNTDESPVQDITRRTVLLYLLTAHIATIMGALAGGTPGPVGRVSSATEGSVSVGFDFSAQPGSAVWFQQTQYGASFWQATSSLRGFRYIAQPTRY